MLEYFIYSYGGEILMVIITAIAGLLGYAVRKLVDRYLTDTEKRKVAKTVMQYVEQVYTSLHGEEKINAALEAAETLLTKKGIKFDADEMRILIEAAVGEFNTAYKEAGEDTTMAAIGFDTATGEEAEITPETEDE